MVVHVKILVLCFLCWGLIFMCFPPVWFFCFLFLPLLCYSVPPVHFPSSQSLLLPLTHTCSPLQPLTCSVQPFYSLSFSLHIGLALCVLHAPVPVLFHVSWSCFSKLLLPCQPFLFSLLKYLHFYLSSLCFVCMSRSKLYKPSDPKLF